MIKIVEVGPRDGLQNESKFLNTNVKASFIKDLSLAGLKNIEISSFVSPKAIPQMKDSQDLVGLLEKEKFYKSVLIPNMKGYEISEKFEIDEISLFTTTSETFCRKNTNCSIDESLRRIQDIIRENAGKRKIRGYLSTVFGCPYEEMIPLKKVLSSIEKLFSLGCEEVSLGDTTGVAYPKQVRLYLKEIKKNFGLEKIAMHFHDTQGMALANVSESLEEGVEIFDSSAAGLGGCPYAKGASGNVATEDLVNFFQRNEIDVGVDLKNLVMASQEILKLLGKESNSKVHQLIKRKYEL